MEGVFLRFRGGLSGSWQCLYRGWHALVYWNFGGRGQKPQYLSFTDMKTKRSSLSKFPKLFIHPDGRMGFQEAPGFVPYRRGVTLGGAVTMYRFPSVPEALAFYDGMVENPDHDSDDTTLAQFRDVVLVCNSESDDVTVRCVEVIPELVLVEASYEVVCKATVVVGTRLVWLQAGASLSAPSVKKGVLAALKLDSRPDTVSVTLSLVSKENPLTVLI